MMMNKEGSEMLTKLGSAMAGLMFIWAMFKQYFPFELQIHFEKYVQKLVSFVYPYIEITFHEYTEFGFQRSKVYSAIERYLSYNSADRAKRLKAEMVDDSKKLVLSMADYEEITDNFNGVKMITGTYLSHVMEQGKAIAVKDRQRKLYTNNSKKSDFLDSGHGAQEEAGDRQRSPQISMGKEYYAKIGKPWKRGYLLYGPPGTGKSTMIAAMANLLDYDVYDLELTAVKDNTELRKLMIETSSKSIIVIEDIDCSLDLTGQRKKQEKDKKKEEEDTIAKKMKEGDDSKESKLDPALIRSGRMDKHIEMSYCCFEAFKVLARNYLDIESHDLFETIRRLLEETEMTPADVAENLMPKSEEADPETCLQSLVKALEEAKERARLKAEEEEKERLKAEEEERNKAKKEEEKETKKEAKTGEEAKDKEIVVNGEAKENESIK
ncbi:unnamed protein product [Thlaspi arvense]|uniref:AAA+ ATPase domain-containing protein n=1 Tax=Thlaspi arvense TaxID=13288 RepID=A0AAU9REZ7_THLAR|nr:unnamed protein product [Thlaspi arvense]